MRRLRKAMFGLLATGGCAMLLAMPAPTTAFGTIVGLGQNAEHNRITRHALGCTPNSEPGSCFEPETLDNFAGKIGDFGAVGAPDRGRGIVNMPAHCDGADYFDVPGYPQTKEDAQAILEQCRALMVDNMAQAVADAAGLLNKDGTLSSIDVSLFISCTYAGRVKGRAKCDVLGDLGRLFHAAQDFYAHSNWVDMPDTSRPIDFDNPPGLNQRGPAPWLDLRVATPVFPDGLITGCSKYSSLLDKSRGCKDGEAGAHRVRHASLNKDTGTIDPDMGAGTTPRGSINDNFSHAVEAAIADSADKWLTFREKLIATYGEERGRLMICAIASDNPKKTCV